MTFDPVAFAAAHVGPPGPPQPFSLNPPPDGAAIIAVDAGSLTVTVPLVAAAAPLEAGLREHGLTLGLFPETFERATVGELLEDDAPGAGASGPGFASRLVRRPESGVVALGVRRRPAAQAGRALAVGAFEDAVHAVRRLAQDGDLPEIALVLDAAAADLWLSAADDPDGARARIRPGGALLLLIASGAEGVAARRVATAVRDAALADAVDLGQNPARGWAAVRYDGPGHAATLARAGYVLEVERQRLPWSDIVGAAIDARTHPGYTTCEVAGAAMHDALLTVRRITAAPAAAANTPV